jgi:excinuclease UvrABC nuclease subunit
VLYEPTETWAEIDLLEADYQLPAVSGVYVVFSETGDCLYVGQAVNLKTRFSTGHNQLLNMLRNGALTLRYFPTDRFSDLELHLIMAMAPKLNKANTSKVQQKKYYQQYGYTPFVFRAADWG